MALCYLYLNLVLAYRVTCSHSDHRDRVGRFIWQGCMERIAKSLHLRPTSDQRRGDGREETGRFVVELPISWWVSGPRQDGPSGVSVMKSRSDLPTRRRSEFSASKRTSHSEFYLVHDTWMLSLSLLDRDEAGVLVLPISWSD